jgi:soluble lytic murein transglycosylase
MTGRHRMRSLVLSFAMLSATGFDARVWAKNADDAVDQTAMAIPRIGMPGARSVALPQPLSPGDVVRIRQIFALQRAGSVSAATEEMDRLDTDILRGAILADRYLNTGNIPETAELSEWLFRYGEQPDAPAIRALLETLPGPDGARPDGARPEGADGPARDQAAAIRQKGTKTTSPMVARSKARPGKPAVSDLPVRTLLVENDDQSAVDAARSLLTGGQAGPGTDDALFAGGVAAWRLGDFGIAKPLFEAAWHAAETASSRAAAAFWTARLADKAHDRASHIFWLRRAASEADTFYGPIARHTLSPIVACLPSSTATRPVVSNADVDALMATGPGRRSFALLQVGERERAEIELRTLWLDSGPRPGLGRSLMLVAKAVGLDQFAGELRDASEAAEDAPGKFELPLLRPAGGFRLDPAFVYAVVRHESNFQPLAVSPVGARGLMQVMPATAVGLGVIGEGQTDRLNDPSINLAAGQRYLLQLADSPLVGDDLLKLIAAYGQGPTGMNRWADGIRGHSDPFVFLEAIPSPFMRQFVEDVLRFHWQYAAALRVRASSLDDLAAGIYPRFAPIKAEPKGVITRPAGCPATALNG